MTTINSTTDGAYRYSTQQTITASSDPQAGDALQDQTALDAIQTPRPGRHHPHGGGIEQAVMNTLV